MTFAQPLWFFLLLVIPLVVTIQILLWIRRGKAWKKLVASRLQKRLIRPRSGTKVFAGLGLAMLGYGLLVTSLAMPEAGEEWVETRTESRNLLLCFDISQSMLTEDAGAGSRLNAAKAAALEITERFPADRIGLITFSGETQVTVPLTIDHSFLNQTLNQLNPLDLPIGGSNLALALNDATALLVETGQRNNVMIVFSDGEDHSSGIETAARRAKSNGIFVYTLGFGSEKGDFIKDPRERGGFFLDRRGNRVVSQLKEESLQTIANETDGVYARGVGGDFLGSLDAAVARLDAFQEEGGHQRIAKPVYQWFLLPALLLLMSSVIVSRLGSTAKTTTKAAMLLLTFFTLSPPVQADELGNAYMGKKANRQGEHEAARQYFQHAADAAEGERRAKFHLASGASAIQAGRWDSAVSSFSHALISEKAETRSKAHFALANALFHLGANDEKERVKSWTGAVSHFEESLQIEETTAARENLEALRKLLEQQQQNEQENEEQENEEQENEEQENEDQEKSDEEKQEEQESQEQEDSENGEDSEEQEKSEEESESEGESEEEQEGDEQKEPGEGEGKPEEEQQEDPGQGEESEEQSEQEPQEQQASENKGEQKELKEETAEEEARRILNQQADFGERPPTSRRRVLRRPEKDW